ncbi:hypothetical protein Desaci_0844 [Desulfosporosinus acidiphilus SJ4]|uniref:Uncharacterized protein n=1 Tax=Desulfosporosinus acidiphilus (strain DSM 22704 / JCM 16185 / SJ4) TaxID=646529 RepID=I4D276_DESAJ|nr:hypothetical protein [Desulfosporosinus acidiphilus]AFM39900.1 hypothetical protein Desaci_0844 [Desulfosporosinus acidiphilus SJ4]
MIAEFKIINDPLRPSICTNLCSVCCRNNGSDRKKIGCCSYEPEFCLFDLVFLYLNYPDIYEQILKKGQIIKGYNGIMVEMKAGLNQCPYVSGSGCLLPKDATTPLCRLYVCRQAAKFGPSFIEEKFDEYFSSKEYHLNQYLNSHLNNEMDLSSSKLHDFVKEFSEPINSMISEIDRNNPPIETFTQEINLEDFKL